MNTATRLTALENDLADFDKEALNALGPSMRGLLDQHEEKHRKLVEAMAFEAVKAALRPFPGHAQLAVVEAFDRLCKQSYQSGYSSSYGNSGDVKEMPTSAHLLGVSVRRKAD